MIFVSFVSSRTRFIAAVIRKLIHVTICNPYIQSYQILQRKIAKFVAQKRQILLIYAQNDHSGNSVTRLLNVNWQISNKIAKFLSIIAEFQSKMDKFQSKWTSSNQK